VKILAIATLAALGAILADDDVSSVTLFPAHAMTRAELWFVKPTHTPKAVLVLCPGANGNGEYLVRTTEWQKFACDNDLGLVGLSFASDSENIHDGTGYYYASKGSGEKLLEGLKKIFGTDLPILLYGTSGGAHFTSRFEAWNPKKVVAWCAYSAMWWDKPKSQPSSPPGIVACGDEDPRLGASLIYFKQGRVLHKPWLWICLPKTGHEHSPQLDDFVRRYFSVVLDEPRLSPVIVDIDQKTRVIPSEPLELALTASLPSERLYPFWVKIHQP